MSATTQVRSSAWRSRWAAVGAAVAVTLGAGGLITVNAASSAPSSFVSIVPTRILDTRFDVGLPGPFVSGVAQKLQVTGTVPTQPPGGAAPVNAEVVPSSASSVVLTVTAVNPQTQGFLSIRPGDATGTPATSNINWAAGGPNTANSVTVQLPASGQIDIFVSGTVGEVLIDVAGYNIPSVGGPAGPTGPAGPIGPIGPIGTTGPAGPSVGTVVHSFAAGPGILSGPYAIFGQLSLGTLTGTGTAVVTASAETFNGSGRARCYLTQFRFSPPELAQDVLGSGWAMTRGFDIDVTNAGAAGRPITLYLFCSRVGAPLDTAVKNISMTAVYTPDL